MDYSVYRPLKQTLAKAFRDIRKDGMTDLATTWELEDYGINIDNLYQAIAEGMPLKEIFNELAL